MNIARLAADHELARHITSVQLQIIVLSNERTVLIFWE